MQQMSDDSRCHVSEVADVFKGKWKGEIIILLRGGPVRFGELKSHLKGITARALTESLRGLERDGVIARHEHEAVPPHVEYVLCEGGQQLLPLLDAIQAWGDRHLKCVMAHREQYDQQS